MAIERRTLLGLLAVGFLGSCLPTPGRGAANRAYLGARADAIGNYRVSGFSACGEQLFDMPLPARGHSCAIHPFKREAVHFARRPGAFALAIDFARGTILSEFATPRDRHFYGHGVFSHHGRLLYASENNFEMGHGVIGVYDAENHYRRLGELASHGVGPHDIRMLSDGTTLVVANGGILTRPDLPRVKLNLPTMEPSLCFVDRRDGGLLQKHRLERPLYQLSIRHLAVSRNDMIAVAMQYEGPSGDLVPLVALCRAGHGDNVHVSGGRLCPVETPSEVVRAMRQYCGSICFDLTGRVIAATSPRGNIVVFWDASTGACLSSARVLDGSGIAPGVQPGEFLVSSGRGGVSVVRAGFDETREIKAAFIESGHWDNHLIAATPRPHHSR